MKSGKISLAMASRCTVARIIDLGGRFFEDDRSVVQVSLENCRDAATVSRIVNTIRDGQDIYRKAVVKAARRYIAQNKSLPISSDDGSAA